jgi:hypothetical protein
VFTDEFMPFASRAGRDTVLRLRFHYSADVVRTLKWALRAFRPLAAPQPTCGGWLPEHRAWFVEKSCFPLVQRELERRGHTVVLDDQYCREVSDR